MPISEDQLSTWSNQGPTAQFTATYETIRGVLNDARASYHNRQYSIFLQGSYKNDTNVYGDSDVDIIIRIDEIHYTDLSNLKEEEVASYNRQKSDADYTLQKFEAEVLAWLLKVYGQAVKPCSKAITIDGSGPRRDADVLVCAKIRRYTSFKSPTENTYNEGICFFRLDGVQINNYPVQHSDNCTTKHQSTRSWFKPTVRIYKNLRNSMIDKKLIPEDLAPSYFLEGMLYNVPAAKFGGTQQQNFRDTLEWLRTTDRSKFVCANEIYYLCHPTSPVTWRAEKCAQYLDAANKYWTS